MNTSYIGKISDKYTDKMDSDIFSQLRLVSKATYILFDNLKNNMDSTNNITCLPADEIKKGNKKLKQLKNANIIKKAKTWNKLKPLMKGSYMINPSYIMCTGDQEEALLIWNIL